MRFGTHALTDRFTLTDLCEQFGISQRTRHMYLSPWAAEGWKGPRLDGVSLRQRPGAWSGAFMRVLESGRVCDSL